MNTSSHKSSLLREKVSKQKNSVTAPYKRHEDAVGWVRYSDSASKKRTEVVSL